MNETMGQIIRRLRKEKNLTQEELAKTALQDMLERLTSQSRYDGLRENPRFINLVNCLKNCSK